MNRPYHRSGMAVILSHIRGMARAVGFMAWTLLVGGAWLGIRCFIPKHRRLRGAASTLSLWSRGLCRLLDIRVTTQEPFTAGRNQPRLLVSNHIGYLDVIVLASVSPALFVSKDDLAGWPVMGSLAKSVGTLFLDRKRPRAVAEVAAGMQRAFADGESVIVFPEGTTTNGKTVEAFHTALFEPALRAAIPVQAAVLQYRIRSDLDPAGMAAWTGDASFVPHLYRLFCGHGLNVRIVFQEATVGMEVATDRRTVAMGIQAWMQRTLSEQRGDFLAPQIAPVFSVEAEVGDGLQGSDYLNGIHRDVLVQRPVMRV